jgi:hypothetical protein
MKALAQSHRQRRPIIEMLGQDMIPHAGFGDHFRSAHCGHIIGHCSIVGRQFEQAIYIHVGGDVLAPGSTENSRMAALMAARARRSSSAVFLWAATAFSQTSRRASCSGRVTAVLQARGKLMCISAETVIAMEVRSYWTQK